MSVLLFCAVESHLHSSKSVEQLSASEIPSNCLSNCEWALRFQSMAHLQGVATTLKFVDEFSSPTPLGSPSTSLDPASMCLPSSFANSI